MNSENKTQLDDIMAHGKDGFTPKNKHSSGEVINKEETNNLIGIAVESKTMEEIKRFRKMHYKDIYPDMDLENDVLDDSALTLYTRDKNGHINSTVRLCVDGPYGFPQDRYLTEYRETGVRLMELGRFIINEGNLELLKDYYRAFFSIAKNLQSDAIVMSMQPSHISFHQKLIGVDVIAEDTETYGGPYSLACVVWELKATSQKFFTWIGREL